MASYNPAECFLINHIQDEQWKQALQEEMKEEMKKSDVMQLQSKLAEHYKNGDTIYPDLPLVFSALNMTPLNQIKIVIVGQDPYHKTGLIGPFVEVPLATGLAFSVPMGVNIPPSLQNIYKLLKLDVQGFQIPSHGCLDNWARNGALLLNSILTVSAGAPKSHLDYGWLTLTDAIISIISAQCVGVVFILFGQIAQSKYLLIDKDKHTVINSAHPSPYQYSAFLQGHCFLEANIELGNYGKIFNWNL